MQKQTLRTCICGQPLNLPEGEVRYECKTKGCHAVWEIDNGGYWFTNLILKFAPIRARAERYNNYPKSKRRKKAGRC